jgi:hypothetical protein
MRRIANKIKDLEDSVLPEPREDYMTVAERTWAAIRRRFGPKDALMTSEDRRQIIARHESVLEWEKVNGRHMTPKECWAHWEPFK